MCLYLPSFFHPLFTRSSLFTKWGWIGVSADNVHNHLFLHELFVTPKNIIMHIRCSEVQHDFMSCRNLIFPQGSMLHKWWTMTVNQKSVQTMKYPSVPMTAYSFWFICEKKKVWTQTRSDHKLEGSNVWKRPCTPMTHLFFHLDFSSPPPSANTTYPVTKGGACVIALAQYCQS